MKSTLSKLTLSFLFALAATTLWAEEKAAKAEEQQPMLGQKAAGFNLKGLDDKSLALKDLKGKFVVIHFAASW